MAQNAVDVLYDVKNAFYLGLYQQCINEAQKVKVSEEAKKVERDVFMYRAYIAQQKYEVVIGETSRSSVSELEAVHLYANYMKLASGGASADKVAELVKVAEKKLADSTDVENIVLPLLVASIYYHEGENDTALRILKNTESLECSALCIQVLLSICRVDLAKKELTLMMEADEDATLTQLANAWYYLAIGGDKLQDAYYIFQEMADKNQSSSLLLNGQATSLIGQGKVEEAEDVLQEAITKDNNCPETLVNSVVISQLKGKDFTSRYMSQLRGSCANHSFLKDMAAMESEFDRLAAQYVSA